MNDTLFPEERLRNFTEKIFLAMGCSEGDAYLAADVLIRADLRGIDSHGVARLSGYVRLWQAERIKSSPSMAVVHETPSTAVLDADKALGLISGPKAMDIAIAKARNVGTGWVAVKNSNHFGIAGYHAMKALEHDMIGISMTNASPLVAPTYSLERMLGTNPMCFAWPVKSYPHFVADLATAAAANGKLEIAQRTSKPIPPGWVQKQDGTASTDPHELKNGGALLPLGSTPETGSHKGYALSAVVDLFSGVLSGANYGPWVPPFVSFLPVQPDLPGEGLGHFFGAIRVDAFRPLEEYYENMDRWVERFSASRSEKKVIIPGSPENNEEVRRRKEGIPVNHLVAEDLQKLAAQFGIGFES